jgi:hyperosmotically inducible protein
MLNGQLEEDDMKRMFLAVAGFLVWAIAAGTTGCTTAYKSAVDQRSLSTQYDDEKITMAIRSKFLEDKTVNYMDISTYCYDGHVFLVGEYETSDQKKQAARLAGQVAGVKSVEEYFLPKKKDTDCGTTDNLAVDAKIRAALIGDANLSSTQIETKLIQCQAVLLGLVKSKADIDRAISLTRGVQGVKNVKSFLTVRE